MRIAIITPHYHPAVRGNAITVRRIANYLAAAGCEVQVFSLDLTAAEELLVGLEAFNPELIHAFHGYDGGRVARLAAQRSSLPYIVTLTGTDLYEALEDGRSVELGNVFAEASLLTVFDRSMENRLVERRPFLSRKTRIVPQGVEIPGEVCPGGEAFPLVEGEFAFFLPAGLRPVKNVLFPLAPLAELSRAYPDLRFVIAGPVLDAAYAATVLATLENYPFARYLGAVDHNAIGCIFQRADVVLGTSLFEGGMANSLLEALALGRPVLASAIDGNRSLVKDGVTGLLYGDAAEFTLKAERLLADPLLRARLGEQGRRFVLDEFPPEKEAAGYLKLYREVLA